MEAYEIQDQTAGLTGSLSQATAELLQEESSTLGGPQQEERIDVREINTFVEKIDREDGLKAPLLEIQEGLTPLVTRRRCRHSPSIHTELAELLSHELCVGDADTEPKSTDRLKVARVLPDLVDDAPSLKVVGGEY